MKCWKWWRRVRDNLKLRMICTKKGATQNSTFFVTKLFHKCSVESVISRNVKNDKTLIWQCFEWQEITNNATWGNRTPIIRTGILCDIHYTKMAKQCKNILSKFIWKNKKKPLQKKKRIDLAKAEKDNFKREKKK